MNCTFPACRCEMPATCTLEKTMEALNTGELRKVAEAATPGPWVSFGMYAEIEVRDSAGNIVAVLNKVDNSKFIAAVNPKTAIALLDRIAALEAENANLKKDLVFVERWANHHGAKPTMTPQEALSCIQHHPSIRAITKSYADGKVPDTPNPWAENVELRKDAERYRWLREMPNADSLNVTYVGADLDLVIDAALKEAHD